MSKPVSIEQVFQRPELIVEAVRKGARQAAREHLAADLPMPVRMNGKIEWIAADEFLRRLDQAAAENADTPATD
jgi:hypothetical protein